MIDRKVKVLNDIELIQQIVGSNDSVKFSYLYDRHVKFVYRLCMSLFKDKQEAEDITHDIFLKLFVSLKSFRGESKFTTWLHRFTHNFCLNHINRNLNKKKLFEEEYELETQNYHEHSDDDILSLQLEILKEALEGISITDKAVLLMRFQSDMSIQDIMVVLKIGESAVKMRIKRAKAKLMEQYILIEH